MKAAGLGLIRSSKPRLFPREHGAYVVLLASWFVGLISAGAWDMASVLLSLAVFLALFVAQEPLKHVVRGWKKSQPLNTYDTSRLFSLLLFGVSGLALLLREHSGMLWVLGPGIVSALAGLWLNHRRASMFAQSLAGFAALTLAGPALVLMKGSGPEVISHAAQVWAELTVFFWSSAMIVNVRIDPSSERPTLLGLVLFLALAVTGYSAGYFSLAGVIALGLLTSRFLWVLLEPMSYRKLSLKKIGIIETIMAGIMITLYAVM